MRDEGDDVLRSLDETFRIWRELGVPVVAARSTGHGGPLRPTANYDTLTRSACPNPSV